jgi:hypothetical protein
MQALGATAALALTAWLGLAAIGLRSGTAEAQGLMSAPACQCSAPTAIPGLDTSLVHCVCGGMACVLSQHAGKGGAENRMQCVR